MKNLIFILSSFVSFSFAASIQINFFDITIGTVYTYQTLDSNKFQMKDSIVEETSDTICFYDKDPTTVLSSCFKQPLLKKVYRTYLDSNNNIQGDTVIFIQEEKGRVDTRLYGSLETANLTGNFYTAYKTELKGVAGQSKSVYRFQQLLFNHMSALTGSYTTYGYYSMFDGIDPIGVKFIQTEPNEYWHAFELEKNNTQYTMLAVPTIGIVWVRYSADLIYNPLDKSRSPTPICTPEGTPLAEQSCLMKPVILESLIPSRPSVPKYNPKLKDYYLASITRAGDTLYRGSVDAYPLTDLTPNLVQKTKEQIYQIYNSEGKLIKANLPQAEYQSFLKTLPKGSYFSTTIEGKTKVGQMIHLN